MFQDLVEAAKRGDVHTEVSYENDMPVDWGTPGSVRLDVVEGPIQAPNTAFDSKTGGATLADRRIDQIQSHVPTPNVPVIQVK